ncbi:MAG: rhodanese-like domain-containing protein [Alphaproteobacteria bacterium]|nr:rhodanese-like domain-containing protein [Alphaproteobacteria bacterium]
MPATLKELMARANQAVPKISHAEAIQKAQDENVLFLDVRDALEVQQSGKIKGAVHVPRGMLEFRADPDSPAHDAALDNARCVIVYCGSGGRAALAGLTLKDMGFDAVYNLGGFKDWADAGHDCESAS